jgi:hypothetical protein
MAGLGVHNGKTVAPEPHEPVEVRHGRLGRMVAAVRDIAAGETIIRTWGRLVPHRSRHTIQVDVAKHIVADGVAVLMNHSCDPNCGVVIRTGVQQIEVRALRPIAAGEEILVDYDTFEYEVAHLGGPCRCGAKQCRGRIAGYRHLPGDVKARYGEFIAEYLRILDSEVTLPAGV